MHKHKINKLESCPLTIFSLTTTIFSGSHAMAFIYHRQFHFTLNEKRATSYENKQSVLQHALENISHGIYLSRVEKVNKLSENRLGKLFFLEINDSRNLWSHVQLFFLSLSKCLT